MTIHRWVKDVETLISHSPVPPAGEVFIPFFYGMAIDAIVVHQDMQYLVGSVLAIIGLALCT